MEVSGEPRPHRILHSGSKRELEQPSLVLTALGIENAIDFDGHGWGLWVADADSVRAEAELASYAEEDTLATAAATERCLSSTTACRACSPIYA